MNKRTHRDKKHPNMQDLMLDLIEQSSFNAFDGHQVHDDLREAFALWDAASLIPDSAGLFIRDLPDGSFHCDTLYILTTKDRWKRLRPIVENWRADSITKITSKGTKVANRWNSDDSETYSYKKYESQNVGSFLGSFQGKEDDRVVLCLWWD